LVKKYFYVYENKMCLLKAECFDEDTTNEISRF